jgi:hypothetical protein
MQDMRSELRHDGPCTINKEISLSPRMKLAQAASAMLAAAILSACGGGGSDAANPPPPPQENQAPVPVIDASLDEVLFIGDKAFDFRGAASDAEDGTLSSDRLSWRVELHRGLDTVIVQDNAVGEAGFYAPVASDISAVATAPATPDVFYRVILRATDSRGATAEVYKDVQPKVVAVNLLTLPGNLKLKLNGNEVTTPVPLHLVQGSRHEIAGVTQEAEGSTYLFDSWMSGSPEATQVAVIPEEAIAYTAQYINAAHDTSGARPVVTLAPPPGPVLGNTTVKVSVTVEDADSGNKLLELFDGDFRVGAALELDEKTPESAHFDFDWTPVIPGKHTLVAKVTNQYGIVIPSAAIKVDVAGTAFGPTSAQALQASAAKQAR